MVWHRQLLALCCAVGQPGAAACLATVTLLVTDLQAESGMLCSNIRHRMPGSACRCSTEGLPNAHLALC